MRTDERVIADAVRKELREAVAQAFKDVRAHRFTKDDRFNYDELLEEWGMNEEGILGMLADPE